jgi:hypothetical protein
MNLAKEDFQRNTRVFLQLDLVASHLAEAGVGVQHGAEVLGASAERLAVYVQVGRLVDDGVRAIGVLDVLVVFFDLDG